MTDYLPYGYDYQGKYVLDIDDANTLTVNTHGAGDNSKSTYAANSSEAQRDPHRVGSHFENLSYHTQNIEWNTTISATAVNKTYLGRTQTVLSSSEGTASHSNEVSDNLFLRDEFRFAPTPNHAVMLGGNYSRLGFNQDVNDGRSKPYKNNFPVHRVFFFAKDRWQTAPDLTLIGGLHWTRDDYLERAYIEPRLGLEWDWSARTLISAGWGKYNQLLQFGQSKLGHQGNQGATDVIGNRKLQRARATHSLLGVSQTLDAGWTWKLEGYYKTFVDFEVALVRPGEPVTYLNRISGTAHGVELLVKKDRSTPWSGWLSVTYSQSRRHDNSTGADYPIELDQPLIATGVLSYKHSAAWSYGARWSYHSGNPYTPIIGSELRSDDPQRPGQEVLMPVPGEFNSRRLPAYHRLDLRVDRHWVYNTWKLNAYFEVLNAYFRKNVEGYGYSDSGEITPYYGIPPIPFIGVEMEF